MSGIPILIKRNGSTIMPKFSDCLLEKVSDGAHECDKNEVLVDFKLANNILIIRRRDEKNQLGGESSHFKHSMACPMQVLSQCGESISEEAASKGIGIAVSVIVESRDNHILLTRRPSHMRSSPGVWVPPGGHLERNESLIACGLREVKEETGLDLTPEMSSYRSLCLWENVYPISVTFGKPTYHSLVIYYHVHCRSNHEDLIKKMRIDPNEVVAFTWLPPHVIAELFSPGVEEKWPQKQFVWTEGGIVERDLKYLSMFYRFVWAGDSIFSGVQCSLLKWFRDYCSRQQTNKL